MLKKLKDNTIVDLNINILTLELIIDFRCQISFAIYTNYGKGETDPVIFHVSNRNPVGTINRQISIPLLY